ncbi:hypothetical protein BC826DRAFT_269399 [Russula brevipes]|nr:hypothetical protein BC826DRAFT_269399 [Russula brevipes]
MFSVFMILQSLTCTASINCISPPPHGIESSQTPNDHVQEAIIYSHIPINNYPPQYEHNTAPLVMYVAMPKNASSRRNIAINMTHIVLHRQPHKVQSPWYI